MITKKMYLKAREVVWEYEKAPENNEDKKRQYKSLEELETGDLVECIRVNSNTAHFLTLGKAYRARWIWPNSKSFMIVGDDFTKRHYGFHDKKKFRAIK